MKTRGLRADQYKGFIPFARNLCYDNEYGAARTGEVYGVIRL
jgi:hypothetical protein